MPISSYPRRGQCIAPLALREVLDATVLRYAVVPGLPTGTHFYQLDETVWSWAADDAIALLQQALISHLSAMKSAIVEHLGHRRLPIPPLGDALDELELDVRTYNRLQAGGYESNLQGLAQETIGGVLALPGFGIKSLLDLLTSLESHHVIQSSVEEDLDELEKQTLHHNPRLSTLLSDLCRQTDALHETAHQLAANAHAGIDFKAANVQLETMRSIAGVLLRDVARWEDVCAQCERPALNAELTNAVVELEQLISGLPEAGEIRPDDPRLHDFVQPIFESIRDALNLGQAVSTLMQRLRDPHSPNELAAYLQELHRQLEALSAITFEEELQEFFELTLPKKADKRRIEVARRRFGLIGNGTTLQVLAEEVGVSRERIRQMVKPHEEAIELLAKKKPFAPLLDEVLSSHSPCFLSHKSLELWSGFLGRQQNFDISESSSNRRNGMREIALQLALKGVRRWGMVTIEELLEQLKIASLDSESLETEELPNIDSNELRSLLESQPHFHWLDKECNWFWFSNIERSGKSWNALLTQIKKVFAVTNRIYVMELREGISRDHRREGFAPPRKVLLELCRQLPWLVVEGEEIILTDKSQVADALPFYERILFQAIYDKGSVATRADIQADCFAHGMNEATFTLYLGRSPIIIRHATSVYGLRGTTVEPGKIEEIISRVERKNKGRARVLQDYGWKDGDLWVGYKVSVSTLNGVCSIPSGLKNFINGEFQLQTFDGLPTGTLACGENQAWGLRPFMKRRGAEVGDYFLLRLDLQNHIARIALGDESLLDEYQAPLTPTE